MTQSASAQASSTTYYKSTPPRQRLVALQRFELTVWAAESCSKAVRATKQGNTEMFRHNNWVGRS